MGEIAGALLKVIGIIKQQQKEVDPVGKKKWDPTIKAAVDDFTAKCMTSPALDEADRGAQKLHSASVDLDALAAFFPD